MYIVEKVTDGLYERFDMEQYMKWYREAKPEKKRIQQEIKELQKKLDALD